MAGSRPNRSRTIDSPKGVRSIQAKGGYARGESTKAMILNAAIDVFGEVGYKFGTTRSISERAGANLSSLRYYFKSKRDLHTACCDHIADFFEENMSKFMGPLANARLDQVASREEMIELLLGFLLGFVSSLEDDAALARFNAFALSVERDGGPSGNILYDRVFNISMPKAHELFCRITGMEVSDPKGTLALFSLIGSGAIFRVLRRQVVRSLGWTKLGAAETKQINQVLRQQMMATIKSCSLATHRVPAA